MRIMLIKMERRVIGVLLILALTCISLVPAANAGPSQESKVGKRLWGQDRYQTAKAIAEEYNGGTTQNVVLAIGYGFADALASSILANKLNAPVLLVDTTATNSVEAFDYVQKHLAKNGHIYLIGGTGIIKTDFWQRLEGLGFPDFQITQIGGQDRYETAVMLAEKENIAVGTPVVIVNGGDFREALTVSSFAAYNGWPMLLTDSNYLPDSVASYLNKEKPSKVYIIGAKESINANVEAQIRQYGTVERLAGNTLQETEEVVLKNFARNATSVYVASGADYADALAGAALAAKTGSPIVLVDPKQSTLPVGILDYLNQLASPNVVTFGGPGAVPQNLTDNIDVILANTGVNSNDLIITTIE